MYMLSHNRREANMIKLEEILISEEKETVLPDETKERLLARILKQIASWMNLKNKE